MPFYEVCTDEFSSFHIIGHGKDFTIVNNSSKEKKITLYFEIRNRITGEVMLTQHYNITSKNAGITDDNSTVDGGIINEGEDDEIILTPDNDENIANNGGGLSIDWSVDNSINTVKDFFNNAVEFFNLILNFLNQLPSWITIPLYTLFTLAIIIFVYHVIRG